MKKLFIFITLIFLINLSAINTFAYEVDDCNSSSQYPDGTDCNYRGDRSYIASYDSTIQYYYLEMPDNYDSTKSYPLIVWLYWGSGDRFSYLHPAYSMFPAIARSQDWIVIVPDYRGYSWMNRSARSDINDAINDAINSFNINETRIHVFGVSMGGGAALTFAKFYPDKIASAASFGGVTDYAKFYNEIIINPSLINSLETAFGGDPTEVPEIYKETSSIYEVYRLRTTPIMMIHGDLDYLVNVSHPRDLNNKLSPIGFVNYIEVEGGGHNSQTIYPHWQDIFDFFSENTLRKDCEGNFDCDLDVDGSDGAIFKYNFGRNLLFNPCDEVNFCPGDFDCDGDCDGTDAELFKQDFGRNELNNPCPVCEVGEWCVYQ